MLLVGIAQCLARELPLCGPTSHGTWWRSGGLAPSPPVFGVGTVAGDAGSEGRRIPASPAPRPELGRHLPRDRVSGRGSTRRGRPARRRRAVRRPGAPGRDAPGPAAVDGLRQLGPSATSCTSTDSGSAPREAAWALGRVAPTCGWRNTAYPNKGLGASMLNKKWHEAKWLRMCAQQVEQHTLPASSTCAPAPGAALAGAHLAALAPASRFLRQQATSASSWPGG